MLKSQIEAALMQYHDPYIEKKWQSKMVERINILPDRIEIDIVLGYPLKDQNGPIHALMELLSPLAGSKELAIKIHSRIEPHAGNQGIPGFAHIKNVIAVASGKGGVGKSTVAVNMALALAQEGAAVGLLDADIYGPSQPLMLNALQEKPPLIDKKLQPIKRYGIQSMSIGYLIDPEVPMVWRGPMIGKAVQQLVADTNWQALDYLIVDLPPGTGDIPLTLCQKIPLSGVVLVTTPQDVALIDVMRAAEMFKKLNVPLLGMIENMSMYHCSQCGHAEAIFGQGGGLQLAKQYGCHLLGSIPLDIHIREMTDKGCPPIVQQPASVYAEAFRQAALKTAAILSLQSKDYSAKFPKIVVENKPSGAV